MATFIPRYGFKMEADQANGYNSWVNRQGIFQIRLLIPKPGYESFPSSVWFGWGHGGALRQKQVPLKFSGPEQAAFEAYEYVRTLMAVEG